jgi:thiamine pyrophosphokinase
MGESGPGKHIVVVANGEFRHTARLRQVIATAEVVIAADGGANWLAAQELRPQVLVGDLDSVRAAVLRDLEAGPCRVERYSPHKDETDTELALCEAVALGATRITLLGALGGRIDHELANILLLTLPALAGVETVIYDGRSYLWLAREHTTVCGEAGDTLSLIPLAGDVEGICTTGLEYPLRGETLRFGPARGVSNVLTGAQARLTWRVGTLLVLHTPRAHLEEQG